jgi:hypothetical protein
MIPSAHGVKLDSRMLDKILYVVGEIRNVPIITTVIFIALPKEVK